MFGFHLLRSKPTPDEMATAKAVKSLKTWKITGRYISLDPAEIMASESYRNAIHQIRKMETDDSWAC